MIGKVKMMFKLKTCNGVSLSLSTHLERCEAIVKHFFHHGSTMVLS